MRWLEIAWEDQGVHEIAGPEAEPKILQFFRDAGRDDITSDEVAWCAAWTGSCLSRAGVSLAAIPKSERLLARSYLSIGTPIDAPRIGCIAVLTRGDPTSGFGHVGFVVGITDTHIALLGGNQSNAVSVRHFPRSQVLGYRWPVAVTPADLDTSGSRITTTAQAQKRDAAKAGGAQILPQPPDIDPSAWVAKGSAWQSTIESAIGFFNFVAHRWPWLMLFISAYYLGRIAWSSGWIRSWRAEDASTGDHVGRQTLPQPNGSTIPLQAEVAANVGQAL